MAPTRHWVTCSSNPGVGGIFSLVWPLFCYTLSVSQVIRSKSLKLGIRLGNPKAAAHVTVRPSVLVTVKC